MNDSVAFVFKLTADGEVSAHSVHRKWADQAGAESLGITAPDIPEPVRTSFLRDVLGSLVNTLPDGRDVYVFENPSTLYYLPVLERKSPGAVKIYLETNWRRYPSARMTTGETVAGRFAKRINNCLDSWLLNRLLGRYVDGFVTVSRMVARELNDRFGKPTVVVRPFVGKERSKALRAASPDYDSNTACVVGTARYHKGVDRLVDRWADLRRDVPDARLYVVGRGHPESYGEVRGVTRPGFVEDLSSVFSECSLYVHPAHYDACPVAVAEASYAGLPCVVTETTGAKELVGLVDPSLICENSADAIVNTVLSYFESSREYRQRTGERAHLTAQSLLEENRRNEFELALERLLGRIRSPER